MPQFGLTIDVFSAILVVFLRDELGNPGYEGFVASQYFERRVLWRIPSDRARSPSRW